MASTVIQVYLKQLLEAYFHPQNTVRMAVLQVLTLVLRQGLVHPVQVLTLFYECYLLLILHEQILQLTALFFSILQVVIYAKHSFTFSEIFIHVLAHA